MANTAAPVSLIPLGSQRIWACSEFNGRAAKETSHKVQEVDLDHGRADVLVPQQFLKRPDVSSAIASKRVAKVA